jgi:hypothetical protein
MRLNYLILILCCFVFIDISYSQAPVNDQKISQEAYFDFLKKGYPADQWPRYQSKYTEEYKRSHYNSISGGGEYQRQRVNVPGLISNSGGQTIGRFSNGQILNSNNQPVGYLNNGTFMSQNYGASSCVGSIRGNTILNCQGGIYYTINGSTVLNAQGYRVASIRGESVYNSSNQLIATISGLNISSLAAYLLFLSR